MRLDEGGDPLRRGKFEIVGKILSIATDGVGKTAILYGANLNFTRVNKYLDLLLREGLISATGSSPTKYRTTEKGLELLAALRNLKDKAKNL